MTMMAVKRNRAAGSSTVTMTPIDDHHDGGDDAESDSNSGGADLVQFVIFWHAGSIAGPTGSGYAYLCRLPSGCVVSFG